MSLHPIRALDHVIDEYRDYLRTEFRAKDPALRAALERELEVPRFLAQEPFYQAHRPFKNGKPWRDLPIDAKLARVMLNRSQSDSAYLHQSQAIEELLSPNPTPVVVTTGTGSGKTEAFLLPVIQSAFEDATRFKKSGLTAILVYPMNALANDQKTRIEDYLRDSGLEGAVRAEQYDRGTPQAVRQEMRANPPHILLTNYMMLEYLLVRPADREDIFANHRCRFLVLDEVHTYRGVLGSNIALLVRRLRVHLKRARQDWKTDVSDGDRDKRFPALIPVGTSATIKSLDESDLPREEVVRQRDKAVQEFFSALTGTDRDSIQVFGEELREIAIPEVAAYPDQAGRVEVACLDTNSENDVRSALCRLAVLPESTPIAEAAARYRLLWDLNRWLIERPMSISTIIERVKSEVTERANCSTKEIHDEVEAALVAGAALPDGTPGALRLRAHRFIRGGWKFHRCVNPDCGRLFPMGEEQCSECNHPTAPLFLCRNCGADYLRTVGDLDSQPLRPSGDLREEPEWLIYEPDRFNLPPQDDNDDDDEDQGGMKTRTRRRGQLRVPQQIKKRPVTTGSLDPFSLQFSVVPGDYRLNVVLVPGRTRCLCCGGTAGSRSVITPVAIGTSAAVKVVAEGLVDALAAANRGQSGHDGKERLLIFSDSRQDAAHQARFIIFASRYDRMRRRLFGLLKSCNEITIQRAVELLGDKGVELRDNPIVPENTAWLHDDAIDRIRAWEEVPLLDEISVNAGYRGTLINLGLVDLRYSRLDEYIEATGQSLANTFGIDLEQLEYLCRVVLDEIRIRGALSRPLLQYHPQNSAYPQQFRSAEWERRMKQPQGFPLTRNGDVAAFLDTSEIPFGIKHHNAWRRPRTGGQGPSLERITKHLLQRFGGNTPDDAAMVDLLDFLRQGSFLVSAELHGAGGGNRRKLLQLNAETVRLRMQDDECRLRCEVCGDTRGGAKAGSPCPRCHGVLVRWKDDDVWRSRSAKRIDRADAIPLVAGEHTAQVTTQARADLEDEFKASLGVSPTNVLACSPTLEMGIDVGGLDAVILRNVPPRPDNYAQRGGRAGRRSRVGTVLGYARSTPHDQYFYDKPEEMIAGEVPAPALSLGNRDVVLRHLNAIVFGAAEPGLAGRMLEYVSPQGKINVENLDALLQAVQAQVEHAISVAHEAWGADVLAAAELDAGQLRGFLKDLPERIRDVIERTSRQVTELRQALDSYHQSLQGQHAGNRAGNLVARLLGIQTDSRRQSQQADDRSAGYPLRRFAEFGLLPGYEFPSEPASLRLMGDEYEEDPISVTRRFGIGQFQPDATVYARRHRWKVVGLDTASPWNPRGLDPTWSYRRCTICELRYGADEPACPRCKTSIPGGPLPGFDYAGFLAKRDENPVLDEEDRYAVKNLVQVYPQWGANVAGRWSLGNGWTLRLSRNEEVRWVNEGPHPSPNDLQNGVPMLHAEGKGYLLCPSCGHIIDPSMPMQNQRGGRRNPSGGPGANATLGHYDACPQRGTSGAPLAITTKSNAEVLRLLIPVPQSSTRADLLSWGLSTGYSLLAGMEHAFMLSSNELDFELEGPWMTGDSDNQFGLLSVAFIDPSLGGSGYLQRIAENFRHVAARALEHLQHAGCETACYRCLKSYQNQRHHEHLSWPQSTPTLEALSNSVPEAKPLDFGDVDDPGPWLEAYAAGVGSPLELKFLRLFEQHGFRPDKQVLISPSVGEAPISVADFAVPDRRLAIYIDGAAFHVGNNLRRDRFIRRRLRNGNPPWRVEELRAADLRQGSRLVERLRSS